MTRRGFFSRIAAAAAVGLVLPRELIVVVPPPPVLAPALTLGNRWITIEQITRQALLALSNNLQMAQQVNRRYETSFAAPRIGSTVYAREPLRFGRVVV
jgi:hypothetical protein